MPFLEEGIKSNLVQSGTCKLAESLIKKLSPIEILFEAITSSPGLVFQNRPMLPNAVDSQQIKGLQ